MKTLYVLGLIVLVAAGCAKKRNPTAGYTRGEKTRSSSPGPQEVWGCRASVEVTPSIRSAEGYSVTETAIIKNSANPAGENLVVTGDQEGISIKKMGMTNEGPQFSVTFKPAPGSIPNGLQSTHQLIKLLPTSELDNNIDCGEIVDFTIERSNQVPKIEGANFPKTADVNSTSNLTLTFTVKAADVNDIQNLHLFSEYDETTTSKENPVYDLTPAVYLKSAPVADGNTYRFTVTVNMTIVRELLASQLKSTENEFEMNTQFIAYNEDTQFQSTGKNVTIKFTRPAAVVAAAK